MGYFKYVIFSFSFCLLNFGSSAQEYLFDVQEINIKDGLPHRTVYDIIQDNNGYIWISTVGAISRYDGKQFKTYDANFLNISETLPIQLAVDKDNNIWYCEKAYKEKPGRGGIFNLETNTATSLEEFTNGQFHSDNILNINYSTLNKKEWFLTTLNGEVYKYNGTFDKVFSIPNPFIFNVFCNQDNEGIYWIASAGQLFKVKQQQILKQYKLDNYLGDEAKRYIFKLRKSHPNFIFEYNYRKCSYVELKEEQFLPYNPVHDQKKNIQEFVHFNETHDFFTVGNELWVQGKNGDIAFRYQRPKKLRKPHDIGYQKEFIDSQNNLWIATGNGLMIITQKKNPFTIMEEGSSIRGIYEEGATQWIGGVNKIGNKYPVQEEETSINWGPITLPLVGFCKDEQGHFWIGTVGRFLLKYIPEQQRQQTFIFEEHNSLYVPFYNKKNNHIWIGTSNGIVQFDRKKHTITPYPLSNSYSQIEVRQFYENQKGIWIVTNQGLFLMDAEKETILKHYTQADGFPHIGLTHLHEDADGIFWLGTKKGGLIRWDVDKHQFRQFTQNDGLSNNTIYAVYEDDFDNLWLPSDYGLMRFDKKTLNTRVYLPQHGIPHEEFNTFSHYQATDGTLYFGGLNGIAKFHPKDFQVDQDYQTPLYITEVSVLQNDQESFVDKTAAYTNSQQITLQPNENILEIGLSLLDYAQLSNNEYAYQIPGYQDQWVYTRENKIALINLPYGDHQLNLKGKGASGSWSNATLSVPIEVKIPFYLQWWFILTFISLVIGSIIALIKRRELNLRKERERLEIEVNSRTQTIATQAEKLKQLDKAKTRFFSNITHEFRTPLTLVIGPVQQIIKETKEIKTQQKLKNVEQNAQNILHLVNQLLDVSKLEDGKMNIEVSHGNIIAYTSNLIDRFRLLVKEKNQQLIFLVKSPEWKVHFDKDKWSKIIDNLLFNALKFTPNGGSIQLSLFKIQKQDTDWIYFRVRDTGIGISPDQLPHIFNRFYQADDTSTRREDGTGIGLALVKELIELQGGTIKVSSKINKGTTFDVQLPLLELADLPIAESRQTAAPLIPFQKEGNEPILVAKEPVATKKEKLQLLLIEDNKEMLNYIYSCIDIEQYEVIMATNGQEGVQKALQFIPDLIISDVMMPIKNGFEMTQTIRSMVLTSHIPIILLTAKSALESKLEGLKKGADAYLNKPFSPEELSLRIRKLIELRQLLQDRYKNEMATNGLQKTNEGYEQEDAFILSVKTFILENLEETALNGEIIGKHFHISRMQLHRKIKALTNQSISQIIQDVRLEQAAALLQEGHFNVSQIAYRVGFSSPNRFSRVFKDRYGKTPSSLLKK